MQINNKIICDYCPDMIEAINIEDNQKYNDRDLCLECLITEGVEI